jgi:hypothetical protein
MDLIEVIYLARQMNPTLGDECGFVDGLNYSARAETTAF